MNDMCYYSKLAANYIDFDDDRSYPSPEEQLFWRLDDLNDRLEEMQKKGDYGTDWSRSDEKTLRYASPCALERISDIEKAIALALEDLKQKYGIDLSREKEAEPQSDLKKWQLSWADILSPQPLPAA